MQVAPAELEDVLLSHPAVADAGVVGMPDEEGGEVPLAFVVFKPDMEVSPDEIITFVGRECLWVIDHNKLFTTTLQELTLNVVHTVMKTLQHHLVFIMH